MKRSIAEALRVWRRFLQQTTTWAVGQCKARCVGQHGGEPQALMVIGKECVTEALFVRAYRGDVGENGEDHEARTRDP